MTVRQRNGTRVSDSEMNHDNHRDEPHHFTYSTQDNFAPFDVKMLSNGDWTKDKIATEKELESTNKTVTCAQLGGVFREVGHNFSSHTTAHGWGRVAGARSRPIKIIWLCVTLTALICSLIHISILVGTYLSFSSEVKWSVSVSDIEFPSVSVCNIQAMSPTTATQLLQDPTSNFYQWYNITQSLDEYRSLLEPLINADEYELLEGRLTQPVGYYENIGDEALWVGHQSMDFVLGCIFAQKKCSYETNFTLFQSAQYFNCYTFNGGDKARENIVTTLSGPHQGLSLVLYLENDNGKNLIGGNYHTTSAVGNAAGVRLVIHSANTRPSPIDQGIDIPPGYSASLALNARRFHRLDAPYGDCVKDGEKDGRTLKYSRHACMAFCQQEYVIDTCACKSSILPHNLPQHGRYRFCGQWLDTIPDELRANNTSSFQQFLSNILCEDRALKSFLEGSQVQNQCECYPECEETFYNSELSISTWPLEFAQLDFFDKYVRRHANSSELKAWQNLAVYNDSDLIENNLIGRNFVRVNVYLKTMTIEEYNEREKYRLPNLFSDIGGTCGLWIGMSIITWCEVVELFCTLIYRAARFFPGPFS